MTPIKSRARVRLPAMHVHPWSAYVAPAKGGRPLLAPPRRVNHCPVTSRSTRGVLAPTNRHRGPARESGGPARERTTHGGARGRVLEHGDGIKRHSPSAGVKKTAVGAGTPLSGARPEGWRERGERRRLRVGGRCRGWGGAGVTRHVGHPPPSRPVVHRGALSGRPATLPLPCVDCEYGCSVGTGSTRWHPPCCRARPCHRTAVCGGATIVCRPPAGTLLYTLPCSWWAASTSDPSCPCWTSCACRWDLNTAPPDGTAVFGRAVAGTRAAP